MLGAEVVNQANIIQGIITGVGFIGAAVGYAYYDIGVILAAANFAVLMLRAPFLVRSAAPENPPDE